jgi:hypothetical protein
VKPFVLLALAMVAAFSNCAGFAQAIEQIKATVVIPEPVRVLGPTQIENPKVASGPPVPLVVSIDISKVEKDLPEIGKWAENAAKVCGAWYPVICHALAGRDLKPPHRITLIFVAHLPPGWAAFANNGTITISLETLSRDFSNYGMVIHELTHLVQGYPAHSGMFSWFWHRNRGVEWLSEGIADYVRFYLYEADSTRGGIRPGQSNYTDSYRSTACFLDYLVRNYDDGIVRKLNAVLRRGDMDETVFKKILLEDASVPPAQRKDVDTLYQSFLTEWTRNNSPQS